MKLPQSEMHGLLSRVNHYVNFGGLFIYHQDPIMHSDSALTYTSASSRHFRGKPGSNRQYYVADTNQARAPGSGTNTPGYIRPSSTRPFMTEILTHLAALAFGFLSILLRRQTGFAAIVNTARPNVFFVAKALSARHRVVAEFRIRNLLEDSFG